MAYTATVIQGAQHWQCTFQGTPTVQELLVQWRIPFPHPCGGRGTCGQCRIRAEGALSPMTTRERQLDSRLSCQTRLLGDAVITLLSASAMSIESDAASIVASSGKGIGAAVDIGTTTVVFSCYDLATGTCLYTDAAVNPQCTFGADVMSRIRAALQGELPRLQQSIRDCILQLAEKSAYAESITQWVFTGNTTMLYLLQGLDPKALAAAPYAADCLFGMDTIFNGTPAYLPPCISAFVGADLTCAVLDSGMCRTGEINLLADIGTNGELALWKDGTLYVTSASAGPAFEGSGISCGCPSVPGAIDSVRLTYAGLRITTIGNRPPCGVCGSGLLDAIACLRQSGALDPTGLLSGPAELADGICLTQQDIRSFQLAKAAIAAGIMMLLQQAGVQPKQIGHFYLAGGFGKHMDIDAAVAVGLFPQELRSRTEAIGNAALRGAASLLQEENRHRLAQLCRHAFPVSLAGDAHFQELFLGAMSLTPLTDTF